MRIPKGVLHRVVHWMFLLVCAGGHLGGVGAEDVVLQLSEPFPSTNDFFGTAVSAVPDVNGDGKWDVAVSVRPSPIYPPSIAGWVRLFDGVNGASLGILRPSYSDEWMHFAENVVGIPDVNGDGFGDVMVSDGGDVGTYIFSGKTRAVIRTLPVWGQDMLFLEMEGDIFGIVLGTYTQTPSGGPYQAGCVNVFNGKTGAKLSTLQSPNMQEYGYFGVRLSVVPNTSGDDKSDLLVGTMERPGGLDHAGRAYLFDGGTSQVLQAFVSPTSQTGGQFSCALSGIPDLTGDGRGEVVIGAQGECPGGSPYEAGRAYLFDGASGALLRTFRSPHEVAQGLFGNRIAAIPDINGDGKWEIAIGAQGEWVGSIDVAGRVYVFDGATGTLLRTLVSPNAQSYGFFGGSLAGMPDVDGKNGGELIVGADGEFQDSGRAYIFFLSPHDRPASVGMDWTLYDSAGALGFRTVQPGVKTALPSR